MIKPYDERGIIEEDIFKASINTYSNFDCIKSCEKDDMFKHIDFYLNNGQSVDVKASNKVFNSEHYVWIELMNIYGNKGWINGKATFIAFSLGDRYVFFKRRELKYFVYNKVNVERIHLKVGRIKPYSVYRRKGYKDKIVLIPLKDILRLEHFYVRRDKNLIT